MTNYKLLFLDVDGTIIKPDDTIEESTKEAIIQVQDKGVEVFLATGRPIHELNDLAENLHIRSFIGYNGAYGIYQGEDLFFEPMNSNMVHQFLDIAEKHAHEAVLYTKNQNLLTNFHSSVMKQFVEKFHLHKNELYSSEKNEPVLGMTLIQLKPGEDRLYQTKEGIHLTQVNVEGMQHCFDVIMDKVNKGYGVSMVLKHLGISREDAIAFGDGMNDKEMLMSVGAGFAMGNSHPDLFRYANHRTTDVTDSGIYHGLKTLGLVN